MSINLNITSSLLLGACILLFSLCAWLAYKLVDQSVTLDHYTQHAELIQEQRDLLILVANTNASNISKVQIENLLKTTSEKNSIFQKGEDHLVINQVSFFFQDGVLSNITTK